MTLEPVQLLTVPDGQVIEVPLVQLSAHPINATIYDDTPAEDLADMMISLQEFGIREPIQILNTGRILSGHRRTKAAKLLGWSSVPCLVRHDIKSDQQAQTILITHNLFQREKTNIERMREAVAYTELISGIVALEKMNTGQKISELRMRRAESCRDLDPELAAQLVAEIKELQEGPVFDAMTLAAKRYKVRHRTLKEAKPILDQIDRLRSEGFHDAAQELLTIYNRNMGKAKEHMTEKYGKRKTKMRARKIEETCLLMADSLKDGMRNLLVLLNPQGQKVITEMVGMMDRIHFHVREETSEEKEKTDAGIGYTPSTLGF